MKWGPGAPKHRRLSITLTWAGIIALVVGAIMKGRHERLFYAQDTANDINQKSFVIPASGKADSRMSDESKPMNILLLYADDWRHDTLSSAGHPIVLTPNIDRLAEEGIRFTHNCVTTSVCWISRATLYTGQYMSRHNTTKTCCWGGMKKSKGRRVETPSSWKELSVFSLLRAAGYWTGLVGKWGIYMPFLKDVDFGAEADGWHYRKFGNKTVHITEKNEADALRFLRNRDTKNPFFLNVAFFATHAVDHDPMQYIPQKGSMSWYANETVPLPYSKANDTHDLLESEDWADLFGWKSLPYFFSEDNEARNRWHWRYDSLGKYQRMMLNYYRMASEVDKSCGRIIEELKKQGEYDNTLIIFTTDNGNYHGEKGLADKWYPHQESIRVPLIIRDPRMSDDVRGTANDEFTLNIDLASTILAAAGVPRPEKMMGRDISDLYQKTEQQQMHQAVERVAKEVLPWRKDWFYEHPTIKRKMFIPSSEALVTKEYKYIYWPEFGYEQMYLLSSDPDELHDLINSTDTIHLNKLGQLRRRFAELKGLVKSNQPVIL